jgi:hypothetical protein
MRGLTGDVGCVQVYAEFVDEFDSEAPRSKSRTSGNAFVRAGGEAAYRPSGSTSASSRTMFEDSNRSSRVCPSLSCHRNHLTTPL